jgi:hypothetical protein
MYEANIPTAQQRELSRLELGDLSKRYGALVGKRRFPSLFLIATEDEEIVGYVLCERLYLRHHKRVHSFIPF